MFLCVAGMKIVKVLITEPNIIQIEVTMVTILGFPILIIGKV